jgi:hypothetical protein
MEMGLGHERRASSVERRARQRPRPSQTCAVCPSRLPAIACPPSSALVCTATPPGPPTRGRASERASGCVWPARISIWREVTYFNSSAHGPLLASNPLLSVRADALASLHPPPSPTPSPSLHIVPCACFLTSSSFSAPPLPTRRPMHV